MLTFIAGFIGFGFMLMAVVLVVVGLVKGKRFLSGQIVPLQEMHEIFSPGLKNSIEIIENERSEQDESGDTNI